MAIEIIISFRCMRFLLVVTLINFFQLVVAAAAEASSSGGLVDIVRHGDPLRPRPPEPPHAVFTATDEDILFERPRGRVARYISNAAAPVLLQWC